MNKSNKYIIQTTTAHAEEIDEAFLGRQIIQIFGDNFAFLGICRFEDRLFTALEKGGEKNSIMILEIDDIDPITEYSFCIVDDRDLFTKVFRRFCEEYKENNNG